MHEPHASLRCTYPTFPRIVCLCGSTRFLEAWKKAYREESFAGRIVLSVGVMLYAGDEPLRDNGETKRRLDELHLRKIDLADEVFVLNVGGYIGESTGNELAYALAGGKPVRTLEPIDLAAWLVERDKAMRKTATRNLGGAGSDGD